jgi:hypothetical protein
MPLILGNELCGEVTEVGERVAMGDAGAFTEIAMVPAALLAKVPDSVSDTDAGQDHQQPVPAADFDGAVCTCACALTGHVPFDRVRRSLGSSRSSPRRGLRQHT